MPTLARSIRSARKAGWSRVATALPALAEAVVLAVLVAGCASGVPRASDGGVGGTGSTPTTRPEGDSTPASAAGYQLELVYQCPAGSFTLCAITPDGSAEQRLGRGETISRDGRLLLEIGAACSYCDQFSVTVRAPGDQGAARTIWRFVGEGTAPPSTSPDGRRLAVVTAPSAAPGPPPSDPTPPGLWVMDADGSRPERISALASGPTTWDPTGTHIAFLAAADSNAATMNIDTVPAGGGPVKVVATVANAPENFVSLSWSPDGRTILLADQNVNGRTVTQHGNSELLAIPAAGGPVNTILEAPSSDGESFSDAYYSPDGSEVAFTVGCRYSSTVSGGSGGTVIANADFTRFHALGSTQINSSPCPLPTSATIPNEISRGQIEGWAPINPASATPATTLAPPTTATTVAPSSPTKPFVGIQCTSITGSLQAVAFDGCNGDTGGSSRPFNITGNGPWTITWASGRTTVLAEGTPPSSAVPTVPPTQEPACPGQLNTDYLVTSGYVNGGPIPGDLHAAVCQLAPLSLQPGTVLTIT
jgi:hypothetical protein